MNTDLERQLSDALHTVTPEPPMSYAFTPVEDVEPGVVVPIDLDVVRRRRRPRYGALLAAAAVVVLGGGIAFAAIAADRSDTAPAAPDGSTAPSARICADDITTGMDGATITPKSVSAHLTVENVGSAPCTLRQVPRLGVENGTSTGRVLFDAPPDLPDKVVLQGGGRLVFTIRLTSTGTCREKSADDETNGPGIGVDSGDGFRSTFDLGVTGCEPAPAALSARIVPGR